MSLAGALSNALSLAVANGNELLDEDVATICLELTVRIGRAKELFKEYHGRHIPDTKNKEKKNDK
jgi:hypothetical protein